MNDLGVLRQRCEEHKVPCISNNTEAFLRSYVMDKQPRRIVEIGSAVGYSGIVFAEMIQNRYGHIWSIEYSFPDYQRACHNARIRKCHNITLYHGDAGAFNYKKVCGQKMDLIYIDGRKRDYLTYLQCVVDIVAPDATIIFDDVIKFAHKTTSLYEYLQKKQIQYSIHQLDEDDGIMVIENAGLQLADL